MTEPSKSKQNTETKDKIIVALDVETAAEAKEIMSELGAEVGAFKIGLQLFTAAGASFVREAVQTGSRIFLDVKFHDIPNTVAKAAIEAARLGVWMFNVHAVGGAQMMRETANAVGEFCERENLPKPLIIAVTVLTSANSETMRETGFDGEIETQVVRLAKLAAASGLDGVVASAREIEAIRRELPDEKFVIVTPGIRPSFATNDDQKRVMTPQQAVAVGANHLVIGRPITKAENKSAAVRRIVEEIEAR